MQRRRMSRRFPASFTSFYAPGVLALLLQHIAITLAALSMVRERLLGTLELFRVSPVSPTEILSGKYSSFLIFLGVISAFLLLLMSNGLSIGGFGLSLGVPILGDWLLLVVTIAFLIFASVGLGFIIASVSRSESQAVQLSMLVLLTSVFFSGFFLRLETLWPPHSLLVLPAARHIRCAKPSNYHAPRRHAKPGPPHRAPHARHRVWAVEFPSVQQRVQARVTRHQLSLCNRFCACGAKSIYETSTFSC